MSKGKSSRLQGDVIALAIVAIVAAAAVGYLALWGRGSYPPPTPTPPTTTSASGLRVDFLDVGQADSTLIQADGWTMLIDGGGSSTAGSLPARLMALGARRLDVVIGTHPHEDHIGGLDAVIDQFQIGRVYLPQVAADTKTYEDVLNAIKRKGMTIDNPAAGTVFDLGQAMCTILAPNSASYEDTNNYSVVLRVVYGGSAFLFTGDAGSVSEKEMLAAGCHLKADVLKVGHHGSTSSTTDAFLRAVSPRYAVIFVGRDNDYGYPHPLTLDRLASVGVTVSETELNGTITFRSDGANLTFAKEKR